APSDRTALLLKDQSEQRENATLPAVVHPHYEDDLFDANQEDEQPHNQRQHTVDIQLGRLEPVFRVEALPQRIERARSDVAEDDAKGDQRESGEAAAGGLGLWPGPMRASDRGEEAAATWRRLFGCDGKLLPCSG